MNFDVLNSIKLLSRIPQHQVICEIFKNNTNFVLPILVPYPVYKTPIQPTINNEYLEFLWIPKTFKTSLLWPGPFVLISKYK